jgi:hypothetical protein
VTKVGRSVVNNSSLSIIEIGSPHYLQGGDLEHGSRRFYSAVIAAHE